MPACLGAGLLQEGAPAGGGGGGGRGRLCPARGRGALPVLSAAIHRWGMANTSRPRMSGAAAACSPKLTAHLRTPSTPPALLRCRHHGGGHLASVGAAPLQPAVGAHAARMRRAAGQPLVHGALPHHLPRQGAGQLPEAAQELRAQPAAPQVGAGRVGWVASERVMGWHKVSVGVDCC